VGQKVNLSFLWIKFNLNRINSATIFFVKTYSGKVVAATSNLACSWGLPRPIIISHPEEIWGWPWARGAPQNFGFPYNISAMVDASDFKFGAQLGFVKAHHKITRRRKGGRGPGLGELPKIWGFHFNIYTTAEARDFKFGTQLGFANAFHKTTPRGKVGVALG